MTTVRHLRKLLAREPASLAGRTFRVEVDGRTQRSTISQLADSAAVVQAGLEEIGVKVKNGSRFQQYFKMARLPVIQSRQRYGFPGIPHFDLRSQAVLELAIMKDILACLEGVDGLQAHVRQALNGPALATPGNDASRAKQFELLMAARFRRAGAQVTFDEPDLVVQFQGLRLGVAAKRPASMDALQRSIRSGKGQLHRAGILGIVAVDFTLALGAHRGPFILDNITESNYLEQKMKNRIAFAGEQLRTWVSQSERGRNVIGVASSFDLSLIVVENRMFANLLPWTMGPVVPDDPSPAAQAFRELVTRST